MKKSVWFACAAGCLLLCGCFGERESFASLMDHAYESASSGAWKKALDFSSRAVALQPENADARILNALALENNGKKAAALEEISRAQALDGKDYFILYTRGRMLFEAGRYDSALESLRAALQQRPSSADALILLTQTALKLKNDPFAYSCSVRLTKDKAFKADPAPWSEIGMILLTHYRNPRSAMTYFYYAFRLAQNNPVTVLNMGILLDQHLKTPRSAVWYYQKYLALTKQDASLAEKRSAVEKRLAAIR